MLEAVVGDVADLEAANTERLSRCETIRNEKLEGPAGAQTDEPR